MSIRRLALLVVIVTYVLIVFGGYVASSESGMGCGPDWPLCNGEVVPTMRGETLVEFGHRAIGAILAILCTLLWLKTIRSNVGFQMRRAANWMMLLLLLLIVMGALVVIHELPAIIITIHLLLAMFLLAVNLYLWRSADHSPLGIRPRTAAPASIATHINAILALIIATIALGAYIKHRGYGLSCGWLECGEIWPSSADQRFQTLHRALAAISALYIMIIACVAIVRKTASGLQKRLLLAVIAVIAQIIVGAFAIVSSLEISWAVVHLALAAALFAVVVELRIYLWLRK